MTCSLCRLDIPPSAVSVGLEGLDYHATCYDAAHPPEGPFCDEPSGVERWETAEAYFDRIARSYPG